MCEETKTKVCLKCQRELPYDAAHFYRNKNRESGFGSTCKECEGHIFGEHRRFGEVKDGEKRCNKCGRWLPATKKFFHTLPHGRLGLHSNCKECQGRKFALPKGGREVKNDKTKCPKCGEWLPLDDLHFAKDRGNPWGLQYVCKKCRGFDYGKRCNYDTKSDIPGYKKCSKCGEEKPMTTEYFQRENKNKTGFMSSCKECRKKYWNDNRDRLLERKTIYTKKNRDKIRLKQKLYRKEHPDRIRESARKTRRNPNHRFATRVRSSIRRALSKGLKVSKTQEYLGCTIPEFKEYLISLFTEGMTWEKFMNREIEIDHIRPLCSFDLTDYEQQKQAFHYTNCRPLWKHDNRSKGSMYNGVWLGGRGPNKYKKAS